MKKSGITVEWMRIKSDTTKDALIKKDALEAMIRLYAACMSAGDKGYEYGVKLQGYASGLVIYIEVFTDMQNYLKYTLFPENIDLMVQVEKVCAEIDGLKATNV